MERLEVVVSGVVQGVFFRASTAEQARHLDLAGWVRNRPDGTVAALFEGERGALEAMLRWCRHGPPGARVDGVDASWSAASGRHRGFAVLR